MKVPFRDGEREVPEHIALWMSGLDTHRLTFEEALIAMNKRQERDFINRYSDKFIQGHFREHRES